MASRPAFRTFFKPLDVFGVPPDAPVNPSQLHDAQTAPAAGVPRQAKTVKAAAAKQTNRVEPPARETRNDGHSRQLLMAKEKELAKLKKENDDLKDKLERLHCKICFVNTVDVLFLPCKHLVCCRSCTDTVMAKNQPAISSCPVCRTGIKTAQRVFP